MLRRGVPRSGRAALTLLLASAATVLASGRLSALRGPHLAPSWLYPADQDQADPLERGEQAADERLALAEGLAWPDCYSPDCAGASVAAAKGRGGGHDASAFDAALYAEDGDDGDDGGVDSQLLLAEAEQRVDAPPSKRNPPLQDLTNYVPSYVAAGAPPLSPCFVRYRPLDLGEAHYPHSLNVAVCVQSPHCRTNYYHVPVLTYKGKQSSNHSTLLLPKDLRKHWRFEFKSVPVACECLRSSYAYGHG